MALLMRGKTSLIRMGQFRREKLLLRRQVSTPVLFFTGLALLAAAVFFVPDGRWSPPAEARRIGPARFDSRVQTPPVVGWVESGDLARPTQVRVSFRFRIFSRPTDFAFVISTSDSPNGGMKVAIDQYANLFLEVGSSEATSGSAQVIKIGEPFDFNQWQRVEVIFNQNRKQLKILVNGEIKPNVSAHPGRVFDIEQTTLDFDTVRLGGANGHNLAGEIRGFRATYGRTGVRIDLVNFKILLALIAFLLWVTGIGRLANRRDIDVDIRS
jgi:hypothetical protein